MHPLTLARILTWTIAFTRHVEARAQGKVHALRPEVDGTLPFLHLLCLPEDVGFFLLVAADISPLPPAYRNKRLSEDPDEYDQWETIIIPIPQT